MTTRLRRLSALATLLGLGLAACTEQHPTSNQRLAPKGVLRSSSGAEVILGCAPGAAVRSRKVAPRTGGDLNGNGVVCDSGLIGAPTVTTDDVVLPGFPLPRN